MEECSGISGDPANLLHRLQRARLIIRQHHADKLCWARRSQNRPPYLFRIDQPIRAGRDESHFHAALRHSISGA
jgi:hypothetical protein